MQHVELAGVHSGDSACVLPAPSLTATQENEISDTVRAIAKGLGVVSQTPLRCRGCLRHWSGRR